jgi:hypothetical protein
MSLGPYNPFRHVEALRRELDRVFPDGFSSFFSKSDAGIGFLSISTYIQAPNNN